MSYLLNALYATLLLGLSPWLLYKAVTTRKLRRGLLRKLLGSAVLRDGDAPCAWFHGVSVGEIHLLGQVVAQFRRRHPTWDCVISTTTDTGMEEACKRFPDLPVFYWPFDFSWSVRKALANVKPSLVVLAEGEIWPNFVLAAKSRGVPVAVINGRMSPRSARRYEWLAWLARPLFRRIDLFAAQTEDYALGFKTLGAPPEAVHVTGSVKYDGVLADRRNARTQELRALLGIKKGELIWIAGSTQAPEEEIVLRIYQEACALHPNLRLCIVPRQRERFEEVAGLLTRSGLPFLRRSQLVTPNIQTAAVILVDTIGELSALWGLADVAFVGGSLDGRRGGQNMIEPAAYGAAVVFGPHVWNFRDTATRLVAAGAAIQVQDAAELARVTLQLLSSTEHRHTLGEQAQRFVGSQQGATQRTLALLDQLVLGRAPARRVA
jgi:3-deoxy-D-manno-octulosonic-acid transferase